MFKRLRIGPRILVMTGTFLALLLVITGTILWQEYLIFQRAVGLTVEAARTTFTEEMLAAIASELLTSFRFSIFLTFALLLGGMVVSLSLAYALSHSILTPLDVIGKGVLRWSQGKLSHQIDLDGSDELVLLSQSLNTNASRQNSWYQILERTIDERSKALEHRAVHLETSVAIAQRITSILEPDVLLQQVTDLIRQRYELTYVGLFLAGRDGRTLALQASTRPEDTQLSLVLPIEEHTLIGWVAVHRRPGLANNLLEASRSPNPGSVTSSELALPLTLGRELLGVLDLKSDRPAYFQREEFPLYQSLADQVAIAIKNAAIYQAEQNQREVAQTLQQVGRALNSTLDLEEVLKLILRNAFRIVPYDRGAVLLWNDPELEFAVALQQGQIVNQQFPSIHPFKSELTNPLAETILQKTPILIDDLQADKLWLPYPGLPEQGAWLSIPLVREETVAGILFLARQQTHSFNKQEVAFSAALAEQAAIALENARLYEQIKDFNRELENQVQRRTLDLQSAYNQLEQLDAAKSTFISIASHELRTPLTVIKGYGQILQKDQQIQADSQLENLINGILQGTNRLQEIVDTMLDMARIDEQTFTIMPEALSVYLLVREVRDSFEEVLEDRNLTVAIAPAFRRLPAVHADREGLRKVFYHLLVNAIKFTPDGGTITVDGRAWSETPPDEDWPAAGVEIVLRDTGIGIDPDRLELIFKKFHQTGPLSLHSSSRTKFKGGGPGLGLALVRGIIAAHGGFVWAESRGQDEKTLPGAAFHLVLPLS